MLDEGYGQPGAVQRMNAKRSSCDWASYRTLYLGTRAWLWAVQMHSGKMSFDEAVEFFQKEGLPVKGNSNDGDQARSRRSHLSLLHAGQAGNLKLREDMKKKQGAAFSLEKFHDDFLRQGFRRSR